jgi:thiol-disulfide isomerase/thioredoxin
MTMKFGRFLAMDSDTRQMGRVGKALASALGAVLIALSGAASAAEPSLKGFERAAEPKPALELRWLGPHGLETSLAAYAGKTVLVNLWATWCAPCIKELPSLQRLQAKLKGEPFALVALSIDRNQPGADKARDMLERLRLDALAFHHDGEGRVFRALAVEVMPTTVIFDGAGREVGRLKGPAEWDAPEAEALIRSFIAPR